MPWGYSAPTAGGSEQPGRARPPLPPPPPGAPRQDLLCIRLDSATPVTVEMASRTVVDLGGVARPKGAQVGRLQGTRCEPPPSDPGPPENYASYALRLPHDPLEHLQRSPPDMRPPCRHGQLRRARI